MLFLLWELYSNPISEKAKKGCDWFPEHFNQTMHWWHRVSVGSLAGYIGEAMGGPPICHAFTMVGKSFDIPAILLYQQAATKNKRKDDLLIKMPDARRQLVPLTKMRKFQHFHSPEKKIWFDNSNVRLMHILIFYTFKVSSWQKMFLSGVHFVWMGTPRKKGVMKNIRF